jgi:hypothetical protein
MIGEPLVVRARVRRVERLAAWVVTGPIGFFFAGVIDWLALVAHVVRARLSGREPW